EARLARVAPSVVLEEARAQPEQARGLIIAFHLRDHFLHELVLRDLDAEGPSLLRVLDARVAAGADEAGRAGRHRETPLIEREHRDLEPLAFLAEQVLRRHLDVVHLEVAGIARENAPLLLERAAREPLEGALDDEGADARRVLQLLLLRIRPAEDEEVVGDVGERDPHLLAREMVAITFLD